MLGVLIPELGTKKESKNTCIKNTEIKCILIYIFTKLERNNLKMNMKKMNFEK